MTWRIVTPGYFAALDFSAGFTSLTGETGAGKSILIDALSLALGERGDAAHFVTTP